MSKFKTTRPRKKQKTDNKNNRKNGIASNNNSIISIGDAIAQLFQSIDYLKKRSNSASSPSFYTNNESINDSNNS